MSTNPPSSLQRTELVIARCLANASAHMTGGPCDASSLWSLECRLGYALPEPLRLFLARVGGGVYYSKHEVFGARRVMIHDIELVPDLVSFRSWLGAAVPPDWLPIHRQEGVIHIIQLGLETAPVRRIDDPAVLYPDFPTFFEKVVLPPG